MKKLYILLFTILISGFTFGQILATEDFAYADGSLVGNGAWANHSGTAGDLLVSSGQALVNTVGSSEDANLPFSPVSGVIYFGIDITVNAAAPITGTDFEYFAHFKDAGFNFAARVDIVAPTGGGDFSVGIASDESTADATWATDLTFGTTYRVVVKFDQALNISQLWVDASAEGDTSIMGEDRADPGDSIVSFGLRQSNSSGDETILVDNLIVSQTFGETLGTKENQIEDFAMYPNPTNLGYVNVSSKNRAAMSVSVFDIIGKQVINSDVINNRLNVSQLKTGIYILKAQQGNAVTTKKLVIQ